MSPSSSGVRSDASTLLFLGGIMGFTWCDAIFNRRLSPLRLGTTTFPNSPPLRISCGVSRISSALLVVLLWHARQLFFRMGRISFSKRSEEHTSELQSPMYLVCRLLLEKKK